MNHWLYLSRITCRTPLANGLPSMWHVTTSLMVVVATTKQTQTANATDKSHGKEELMVYNYSVYILVQLLYYLCILLGKIRHIVDLHGFIVFFAPLFAASFPTMTSRRMFLCGCLAVCIYCKPHSIFDSSFIWVMIRKPGSTPYALCAVSLVFGRPVILRWFLRGYWDMHCCPLPSLFVVKY